MRPTDEEIEKFAANLLRREGGLVGGTINDILVEIAKWARDQQPKWISVNESLPENGVEVLCVMKYGPMKIARLTNEYGRPDWYYGDRWINGVMYWMPLPEVPASK